MSHPQPPPPVPGAPPLPPDPAPERRRNGFAIAALVLGILGPCGGPLSLIFGIIALVQIRKRGERGAAMAISGMALTVVWAVALVAGAVVLVSSVFATRDDQGRIVDGGLVSVDSLRIGDCLTELPEEVVVTVDAVPCAEPHQGEVFALFNLADGDYPGEQVVFAEAEEGCGERLLSYAPETPQDPGVHLYYLYPTSQSWEEGDREIVCITHYPDGDRTGSLRD